MRQPSPTRDRLIHTAAQLLSERSYFATGVDQLCSKAAVRKGSFYHFFPSKTDLALAALDLNWHKVREQILEPIARDDQRGLDRLRTFIGMVDTAQTQTLAERGVYLGCPFGNLGQETANQDNRLGQAVQTVFDSYCDYFERWLKEAEDDGQVLPGDNRTRARHVLALFEGALLLSKVAADPTILRGIADPLTFMASAPA